MHVISGCNSVSIFSNFGKIRAFQTLKNKIDKLADIIDYGKFPSTSKESPLVVTSIQFLICLYEKHNSGLNRFKCEWITIENAYQMNLNRYRLSTT